MGESESIQALPKAENEIAADPVIISALSDRIH
jgi:hypothetical protein